LQQFAVATNQRASVDVVFGLSFKDMAPLLGEVEDKERWSYLSSFDLSQPWSQRNIYSFCTDLPANLKVTKSQCWIVDFRNRLVENGEKFPTLKHRFTALVTDYLVDGLTDLTASKEYVWRATSGEIKACFMTFTVDHHKNSAVGPSLDLMRIWDNHTEIYNDEASRFARGAWHSSELWVRAQASAELISSTVLTLVVVLVLAFIGMLMFTFDVVLSLLVVAATIQVLCLLGFFITTMMGWAIGPLEVIALIVFIGYAVTYSLHIAHKYGSDAAVKEPLPKRHSA